MNIQLKEMAKIWPDIRIISVRQPRKEEKEAVNRGLAAGVAAILNDGYGLPHTHGLRDYYQGE